MQRVGQLLRWLPVVPLPDGGRALVQPIHQDDVTRCLLAALRADWTAAASIVIAGPAPMPYAAFVRAIALAFGLPAPCIVAVPAGLLRLAAHGSALLPLLPRVGADEIRRLMEDKAFDISAMLGVLRVAPVDFPAGLLRIAA